MSEIKKFSFIVILVIFVVASLFAGKIPVRSDISF